MIQKKELIAQFERMEREHWSYTWGAAKEGNVDCSGAFVWAYRQFGEQISHGSNSIARKHVGELLDASEAKPGFAVFKVRAWTNAEKDNRWYDTAPGDVYHVGLMGEDGLVLNAQGTRTGFVASPLSQGWDYAAKLLAVEYDDDAAPAAIGRAKVVTQKDPLRIRAWPVDGNVLGKAPKGAQVELLGEEDADGWTRIAYNGLTGYVSARYLEPLTQDTVQPETPTDGDEAEMTTLINALGQRAILPGRWRVADD